MKVGLDVRMIQNSGIGTTIREFLNHLDDQKRNDLIYFSKPDWVNKNQSQVVSVPYPIYSLRQHFFYPRLLSNHKFTFFHMTHFDIPYFYEGPFIATVYDLIHILFPEYSNKPFSKTYASLLLSRVAKKAKRILTISVATKKDLIEHFPESKNKIEVIYPGVSSEFRPASGEDQKHTLDKLGIRKPYLLYVGNMRGSKNTEGLIRAYGEARRQRKDQFPILILAGKNTLTKYEKGFPPGVHHIGEIPRRDLNALYSASLGFVFPSFYEGFGLPPLEAMACGAPVLCSDRGALPEACGDAAYYVDPRSESSMVSGLIAFVEKSDLRQDLISKGKENIKRFSWSNFANQTWDVYRDVASEVEAT